MRAALQEKHAHQLSACTKVGIPYRTHKDWMAKKADEGSELEAYQREVLLGLIEQSAAALDAMEEAVKAAPGTHATSTFNMLKWRYENRFRSLHDEPAQKVELTGKDGEPLANASITDLISIIRQTQETAEE